MTRALARIAELVRQESGVSRARRATLERALAVVGDGIDADAFALRVRREPELLAQLLDEVTVKETFFERDRAQLDSIDWHALRRAAKKRGSTTVDVWTAGCATGEESYTLALRALTAFGGDPPVRILGTDISRTALARAAIGCYGERSLRLLAPVARRRHFAPEPDGSLRIAEHARSLVRFAHHNLVRDLPPPPARFDLVLCRNVLIYFEAHTVAPVLQQLRAALAPGGRLVLGAADALCLEAATSEPCQLRTAACAPSVTAVPDHETCLVEGLTHLQRGDAASAVASFRRALYLQPLLAVAAFQLGRAYESTGDRQAAQRSYAQALRTLEENAGLVAHVGAADVSAACRARIEALA